ncbi:ester cyclase [Hymenobacter gummosus]|nr:ester cyclase [Hymenobacter gummosus]
MDVSASALLHWYEDVWNQRQEHRIQELVHPEAVIHGLGLDETRRGPELFREFYQGFSSGFTDIQVTVQRVVAEDEYETALCDVTARHRATGQPVSFSGLNMVHLRDGQIYEAWNQFDFLQMYRQLGQELAPANVPAGA